MVVNKATFASFALFVDELLPPQPAIAAAKIAVAPNASTRLNMDFFMLHPSFLKIPLMDFLTVKATFIFLLYQFKEQVIIL